MTAMKCFILFRKSGFSYGVWSVPVMTRAFLLGLLSNVGSVDPA